MSSTEDSKQGDGYDCTIRFRAEFALRDRLKALAKHKHKKMSPLLRELAWEIVENHAAKGGSNAPWVERRFTENVKSGLARGSASRASRKPSPTAPKPKQSAPPTEKE